MKIDCIADTHGHHRRLNLEGGDILIHAGDIEATGFHGLVDFMLWFEDQDYKHKIFIGGNHDFFLQDDTHIARKYIENKDVIYLQDQLVEIQDIKIWGSPWALPFHNWAFMKPQEELDEIYEQIPDDIDILITHSPPKGTLDRTADGFNPGVDNLPMVPYIICGHIHEGYGEMTVGDTRIINAAVLDERYNLQSLNEPITFEI